MHAVRLVCRLPLQNWLYLRSSVPILLFTASSNREESRRTLSITSLTTSLVLVVFRDLGMGLVCRDLGLGLRDVADSLEQRDC